MTFTVLTFLVELPYFQMMLITKFLLFQLSFQIAVKPYVTKSFNNTEVLNGFTSMAILYLFLAISTGLLPDEDAPGDYIIAVFLINLSITGGLLFKNIAWKYFNLIRSFVDKKCKKKREDKHIHNLKKLNNKYPNVLLGIESFLY